MNLAIKRIDCSVICGYRGKKDQNDAYNNGYSKLKFPQSSHNKKPSWAMDVIPYPSGYDSISQFKKLAKVINKIAAQNSIKLIWGGSWKWKDYAHYELRR